MNKSNESAGADSVQGTLVACGADKAVAVLGALRTGLISALFIDQAMAEKILAGFAPANREL
jgi:DNA-binding transcriptional regulator LsrR (DeoR family)